MGYIEIIVLIIVMIEKILWKNYGSKVDQGDVVMVSINFTLRELKSRAKIAP